MHWEQRGSAVGREAETCWEEVGVTRAALFNNCMITDICFLFGSWYWYFQNINNDVVRDKNGEKMSSLSVVAGTPRGSSFLGYCKWKDLHSHSVLSSESGICGDISNKHKHLGCLWVCPIIRISFRMDGGLTRQPALPLALTCFLSARVHFHSYSGSGIPGIPASAWSHQQNQVTLNAAAHLWRTRTSYLMGLASRARSSPPPCRLRQPVVRHWAFEMRLGKRLSTDESLQKKTPISTRSMK